MGYNGIMTDTKILEWHTEKRKVSDLVPYPKNPRRLTEKQANDLRLSLEKFNLVEIPAINTDGVIIAGHQRIATLAVLGRSAEEIDVRVPNRKLTDDELREYNIRSNKNTGEWDFDALANWFDEDELKNWGFELSDFGMSKQSAGGEVDTDEMEDELEHECPRCHFKF